MRRVTWRDAVWLWWQDRSGAFDILVFAGVALGGALLADAIFPGAVQWIVAIAGIVSAVGVPLAMWMLRKKK